MKDISREIGHYVDSAITHGTALDCGDSETANRAHDDIIGALLHIRSMTGGSIGVLEPLLYHEHPSVRSWAATHLLSERPEKAREVLNEIVDAGGLQGFSARIVLEEWINGNLRPPWEWFKK